MEAQRLGRARWRVNFEGQTFAIIEGPVSFRMGSPSNEPEREPAIKSCDRKRIGRRFAIATKEVTNDQYYRFLKENPSQGRPWVNIQSPDLSGPVSQVGWYEAAAYCNWLMHGSIWSPVMNRTRQEICRGDEARRRFSGSGYRLPTEAEWEYACRAGRSRAATTANRRSSTFCTPPTSRYGHPAACSSPTICGLFDMLGNVGEWCLDEFTFVLSPGDDTAGYTTAGKHIINEKRRSVYRGFGCAAFRYYTMPQEHSSGVGFRPVRTYP